MASDATRRLGFDYTDGREGKPPFGTQAQHFTAGHEHLQFGTGLTTVPHNGIKPRTGTKSRTEARLARCASRCPLYTSVASDWTRILQFLFPSETSFRSSA